MAIELLHQPDSSSETIPTPLQRAALSFLLQQQRESCIYTIGNSVQHIRLTHFQWS